MKKKRPYDPLFTPARNAAKAYLHPLPGDFLQEAQVTELARIIKVEMREVFDELQDTICKIELKKGQA